MIHATYAYPTTVTSGSQDIGATNGSASGSVVSPTAPGMAPGGAATIFMSRSSGLGNWFWWVMWGGFTMPALPSDAVITGIYGVVTCSHSTNLLGNAISGAYFGTLGNNTAIEPWTSSPPSTPAPLPPNTPFTSTQFITASLGTDPSIVTNGQPFARLFATLTQPTLADQLLVTQIAYIVEFESASAIVIPHGANCNAYSKMLNPHFGPGNGILLGDMTGLTNWCRANGISAALAQDSQRACIDILKELLIVANSAPVYSGDTLKLIPWDEVSAAGNGAIFIAPTASGPVANLTDKDYHQDGSSPPVKINRDRRTNCDNVVSIEHVDRIIDYAHSTQTVSDQMSITLYGTRKGGTLDSATLGVGKPSGAQAMLSIYSATVAQAIASIMVKVSATDLNKYKFTLNAEWCWLEAMDLVTLTDPLVGLDSTPVRLLSVVENEKQALECEGEDFIYGLHHPSLATAMQPKGSLVSTNINPGLVNPPIIFEPTQAMVGAGGSAQIWFIVSGADPNYGGCVAFISIDGGVSYTALQNIPPGITGVLTAAYPLGADPDITDTLSVNLTESNGSLSGQTQATADLFLDQCYLESQTSSYESVCPTVVTQTGYLTYSLSTYIRRAVLGTISANHALGARFGVMNNSTLKVNINPLWYGKTLYFKFAAYNLQHGQQNPLGICVPYTFTVVGLTSTFVSMLPSSVLSQPANTYSVVMATFAVTWSNGNITTYAARTFSVPDLGGVPQTYYVTIYDPTQVGDGSTTVASLLAYCDADATRANSSSDYLFVGKIIVTASGDNTGGPGGPNGLNAILIVVLPNTVGGSAEVVSADGTIVGTTPISADGTIVGDKPISADGTIV